MKTLIALLSLVISSSAWAVGGPAYLYDAAGNALTSTGGALNISGSFSASVASDGTTGAAVPAKASYVGGNKSGNLQGLLVGQQTMANSLACVLPSDQSAIPVTGTFWQSTQPISAASLPLPTGAATAAKQPALGTAGTASTDVITVQGIASMTALKVDGSAVTQPVSATTLPLPTGAATAAKQPALGTAGTPSADVITVQGAASMTALKVDGSGVTQPVSGTVTANQGGSNWSTNVAQINGVTPLMGNGVTGTGSPRVTIASDNTPFTVNAAESGTWTTRLNDGAGTSVTVGQKTMSSSLPVTIASDQSGVQVKSPVNVTPSLASGTATTTPTAVTAPANTTEVMVQALDTNTANLRVAFGATCSSSNGFQLQPGRSETLHVKGDASICSESGSQGYVVQWVAQ